MSVTRTRQGLPSSIQVVRPSRLPHFDLDELEDSIYHPFLVNPRAFLYERQRRHTESLYRNDRPDVRKVQPHKWKVQGADCNAWRENTIDTRTIYNMKQDVFSVGCEGLRFTGGSIVTPLQHADQQRLAEIRYIEDNRRPLGTAGNTKRFTLQIMQRYNKAHPNEKKSSYGAPAGNYSMAAEKSTLTQLVDTVVRPPSAVQILHNRPRFTHCQSKQSSKNFCNVLGPVSCKCCIEETNRRVAREVEYAAFPPCFDCSATSLVAPKLSQVLVRKTRTSRQEKPVAFEPNQHRATSINCNQAPVKIITKRKSRKQKCSLKGKKPPESEPTSSLDLAPISHGPPTLSGNKRTKVRLRLYDRQWEVRANEFFPNGHHVRRENPVFKLSEQQQRLRGILNNIKYKSATGANM